MFFLPNIKKLFSERRSIVRISFFLIVVIAIAVGVWFFRSRQDSTGLPDGLVEQKIANIVPKPFQDISTDHKNYKAIKYLAREGVLEGDMNGKLSPQQPMTRAEWAVLLVKLAGIDPDQSKYNNCYADVGVGETEAAICYAKEQGWLEELESLPKSFRLLKEVFAQVESDSAQKESFNPNTLVKETEAVDSLSKLLDGNVSKIYDAAPSDLTKENAANIIHRSLATISLGNEEFTPESANQLERYYVEELIDSLETTGDSFSDFVKGQRGKNYQDLLAQDQASGIETPTFNTLDPLQNFVTSKAGQQPVSMEDILMYRRTPPGYDSQLTSDPTIRARDSAEMNILLDNNFRIMTKNQWSQNNPSYVLKMDFHHFYNNGQAVGSVLGDLVNFQTGIIEQSFTSPRGDFNRLNSLFNTAVNGIESLIGREIIPPAKSEQKPDKSTGSEKDENPYEFTREECQEIADILPVFNTIWRHVEFPSFTCVVSSGEDSMVQSQDADISFANFSLAYLKDDQIEEFREAQEPLPMQGKEEYKRSEFDILGGREKAIVVTFIRKLPNFDGSSIIIDDATSQASMLFGKCSFGFAGEARINYDPGRYDQYHQWDSQQGAMVNSHPGFDHGATNLHQMMIDLVPQVSEAVEQLNYCGWGG